MAAIRLHSAPGIRAALRDPDLLVLLREQGNGQPKPTYRFVEDAEQVGPDLWVQVQGGETFTVDEVTREVWATQRNLDAISRAVMGVTNGSS